MQSYHQLARQRDVILKTFTPQQKPVITYYKTDERAFGIIGSVNWQSRVLYVLRTHDNNAN